jgi:hypothetical protein
MGVTIQSVRRVVLPLIIVIAIFGLLFVSVRQVSGTTSIGTIDLLQYYAGAKLWLAGQNPYNSSLVEAVERSVSSDPAIPVLLWNPPETLPVIAVLGLMNFQDAVAAWMLLAVVSMSISLKIGLSIYRSNDASKKIFQIALLCTFYPFALCVGYGQISFLLLLGLSLFLLIIGDKSDALANSFRAGVFLSLVAIKPHLLYLGFILLFVLSFRTKTWQSILGFLAGAVSLNLIATIRTPDIHAWYQTMMAVPPIYWQTPTLGSWLQGLSQIHQPWMRILPSVIFGLGALVVLFRVPKDALNQKLFLALIPLSLVTSPYGWTYDQMLMLPTMLWLVSESESNVLPILLLAMNVLVCATPAEWGQQSLVWYPGALAILAIYHYSAAQKRQEA